MFADVDLRRSADVFRLQLEKHIVVEAVEDRGVEETGQVFERLGDELVSALYGDDSDFEDAFVHVVDDFSDRLVFHPLAEDDDGSFESRELVEDLADFLHCGDLEVEHQHLRRLELESA